MTETVAVPHVSFRSRSFLLKFYFVLACITGTTITILELVALPLTWWAHSPQLGDVIGVIHGVGLYPLYVITCLVVAFGYRVSIPHMAAMALAGLLPFASPLVAIWTLHHLDKREAEKAAKAAAKAERIAKKKAAKKRAAASAADGAVPGQAQQVEDEATTEATSEALPSV
jgi:integral membrane protein